MARGQRKDIALGATGMLLTGGSNHRNEVEYDPYYPTLRRIKEAFPHFRIALHTALVERDTAQRMEHAGIDTAMLDVIGAQDTITQVYHLRRSVDDFERALETLTASRMQVVPHIVIGLHYGKMLGEWNSLAILQRNTPSALVLVVAGPKGRERVVLSFCLGKAMSLSPSPSPACGRGEYGHFLRSP